MHLPPRLRSSSLMCVAVCLWHLQDAEENLGETEVRDALAATAALFKPCVCVCLVVSCLQDAEENLGETQAHNALAGYSHIFQA